MPLLPWALGRLGLLRAAALSARPICAHAAVQARSQLPGQHWVQQGPRSLPLCLHLACSWALLLLARVLCGKNCTDQMKQGYEGDQEIIRAVAEGDCPAFCSEEHSRGSIVYGQNTDAAAEDAGRYLQRWLVLSQQEFGLPFLI